MEGIIIYNLTFKVNHDKVTAWMAWQQQKYIPEVLATGLFDEGRLYRLLGHDDEEGLTLVTQLRTSSLGRYQQFVDEHDSLLSAKAFEKWGDGFTCFRSVMEAVQQL
jgi:hypothetical protein